MNCHYHPDIALDPNAPRGYYSVYVPGTVTSLIVCHTDECIERARSETALTLAGGGAGAAKATKVKTKRKRGQHEQQECI